MKKFKDTLYYYCLSFTLEFDYNDDTVFIAYSRPFKYTKICQEMVKYETALAKMDPANKDNSNDTAGWDKPIEINIPNCLTYTRKQHCLTLSGLPVPIITVTAQKNLGKKY